MVERLKGRRERIKKGSRERMIKMNRERDKRELRRQFKEEEEEHHHLPVLIDHKALQYSSEDKTS